MGARGLARRAGPWLLLIATLFAVIAALRLLPHPPLQHQAPGSQAAHTTDGALLRLTLADDEQYRLWTPLDRIDPRLIEGVLLYEDRWFHWHPGVNPASLVRGAWSTATGDTRRGASTITMQLARRLYRIDSRSIPGKLRQIGAALWLTARYSKREVLEAYLNLAPYGSNIEGAGAASLVYFGKRVDKLTVPEALALAVIPQNPNRRGARSPGAAPDAWPHALAAARGRLWNTWAQRHPADATPALRSAMALPLHLRSTRDLPFRAPHAVQAVLARHTAPGDITLTLDQPTQAAVERAIAQYIERRKGVGITNAAALLVDTDTMQVRAWVGSADWTNDAIDGQVNATRAKRSPGSALKPFIYALGIDQGVIHPRSILKDAPMAFGTYHPENFDGRFEGPVTAQDALVRSRNVPAVSVASRLSKPSLYDFLQQAGVQQMASERHYGLALSLGGGEVTMEEVARLYATLANRGEWKPLVTTTADAPATRTRLLSEEAAFITLDMLQANPRPDTGQPAFPRVAWKTGTSWGFRDAWTAGVFGRMVLVVWVGHFDGSPNPAFVGVQAAAPLFFQIADSLRSQGISGPESASPLPSQLARVDVCAASGDLPNAHCKDLASTWFIPGKSPIKVSTLHRVVKVDASSGRAACHDGPGVHEEVFEYWSSDMLQLFAQAGMPRRVPPAPARCGSASASAALTADGPQIVSPLRAARYVMRLSKPAPLSLKAEALRAGPVYWFADAAYLGSVPAGRTLEWQPPAAGRYVLSAVDAQGVSDTRELAVEFAP